MFIPFVNVSIWFIWGYNSYVLNIPKSAVLKSEFIAFCYGLIVALPYMLLYEAFYSDTIAGEALSYIFMYLVPFSMVYSMVKFQEKLGLE